MGAMTLRTELEAMLEEFEHLAYDGAPIGEALDKVREILDGTKPKVLTTAQELDSEEASKALGVAPVAGGGIFQFYSRRDGHNEWAGMDSSFFTSAELLAYFANLGDEPAFTLITG